MKRPFGRGITPFRGLTTVTMVIDHLLNGMILQVKSCLEKGWGKLRM